MSISLTDKFDNKQGQFLNYDTYLSADKALLDAQSHVDIRSFITPETYKTTILEMGLYTMTQLDAFTMTQLDGLTSGTLSESWSSGTVAENSSYGYYSTLTLSAGGAGTLTSSSVITNPDGSIKTVDILTGFKDTDVISIGFPEYPNASVTEASSYIDFTSHPTGDFTAGPTASVSLSASTLTMTNGTDSEFRVARSAFNQNGIDLSAITGVRFRIVTTGATKVVILGGIRLISSGWARFNNDINTLTERLVRTPPLNGDHTSSPTHSLPVLWRSDIPSGEKDPTPIDVEAGILFYTGHQGATTNSFTVYFRENTLDFMTQTDLDGMTMEYLDGNPQPDLGNALYTARQQTELELLTMADLDGDQQYDLERAPDSIASSWISIKVQWTGGSGDGVIFANSEGTTLNINGFTTDDGKLLNNKRYLFVPKVEENSVSADIYELDTNGFITDWVFHIAPDIETGLAVGLGHVTNDFEYKRRPGRFGWQSNIIDANAWVDGVIVRKAVFAEYRSRPLHSTTPVNGARLFTTNSPPQEFFEKVGPGPYNVAGTSITYNPSKYTTGNAVEINGADISPLQGIQTNLFYIENFNDLDIKFDIYCSDTSSSPIAFLLSQSRSNFIPLLTKTIKVGQWNSVEAYIPEWRYVGAYLTSTNVFLNGSYSLVILRPDVHISPWWIDNIRIQIPTVVWDGRGEVGTAWDTGSAEKPWTPFKDIVNDQSNGIVFPERGTTLQIRAKGLTQESSIARIEVKPKYTELGRIIEY